MAFAHIISLLNTIQFHFLQPLPCLIFDDTEMVESLCEKIRNLQGFLEESHKNNIISNQARRVLESKIRGVAHDAEGWIESELHRLYMRFNNEFRENPGLILTSDNFPGPSSGTSQGERKWIRTVTRTEEYPVNRTEEDPMNLPKREKNIKERPVKSSQSLYQALQQVKRRLESIERRFQIERNSNHSAEPQRRNTIENIKGASSFSEPSSDLKNVALVGRDDEFLAIMQKLISDSEKREVISISGMGGIGKTTLVKKIYEDATIISHFDIRAWVTVSQEHNLKEILIGLHGSIVANGVGNSDLEDELRRKLIIRRYLIVIDDIWSNEAWDDIHRWFPKEEFNGSRILLTTRLKQVANYASSGNNNSLDMRFLNFNESWNLFYKKVFEEKRFSCEFESVGRGIVTKCQGLPLTIIVVAGLLTASNKTSLRQWGNVAENLNSLLNTDPEEKCRKTLLLSYENLPIHLKVCFLYFGVFPEDTEICVKALIRLWVAEGFLKLDLNNSMEEVGETYLQDLVDRGLVQIDKLSSNGKMKSCRLHDRLHSFCLREVEREKLLCVINEKNVHIGMLQRIMRSMSTGSDPKACRWISSQIIRDLDVSITRASKEIRSILYFTNEFKWTYLSPKPFTCLKLLRVLDIRLCLMDGIPSEIVNLVHLRYLALRNDSVLNLQWLKLQSLQTVIINTFDDSESYWGSMLHVLDMPRLRHVYLPKSCFLNLPKLIQCNLQTIFWLSLPQRLRTKLGFKTIPNVKELGIYIKDKDPYKLLPGSLADLYRLENLKIAVKEDIFFRDWRTENGFYKLKHLQIVESDLKHWTVIADHFPVLECLILSCCENLEEFPSAFADITTLQLIKLTRCCSSIVTSAKQIQEERLDFGDNKFVVRDFRTVFGSEHVRQFSRREDAGYISSKKKLIYVKKKN
ncbi:putative late blight resistance protein homolog R1B-14 isoform X2 [Ipomoea triloba]|uniref:putative late blight resistance protein homolog R1B-14 isoform X2 n=1 Tax=Ipomoea triloba TaxID=35885 RepID=UPI00125E6182|nr:putative late blight resistance protein homolog R1B-14 isoform X2 [Ipomoea triloba]